MSEFLRKGHICLTQSSWCSGNSISLFSLKCPMDVSLKSVDFPAQFALCGIGWREMKASVIYRKPNLFIYFFSIIHFINNLITHRSDSLKVERHFCIFESKNLKKKLQRSKESTLMISLPPLTSVTEESPVCYYQLLNEILSKISKIKA